MTKRASKRAASAPKAEETPRFQNVEPAVGPNVDGLTHLAMIAHATDDDERALIASELEARHQQTPSEG